MPKKKKWRVTDKSGKEVKFDVFPAPPDYIVVEKWEIGMELKNNRTLMDLIAKMREFMESSPITKIEVEEEEIV